MCVYIVSLVILFILLVVLVLGILFWNMYDAYCVPLTL